MKKITTLFIVFLSLNHLTFAQTNSDKEKVQRTLMDYIEGFYEGDSAKIIRSVSPAVTKYGYWKGKNSTTYAGEPMSYKEMVDYAVAESKKRRRQKLGN